MVKVMMMMKIDRMKVMWAAETQKWNEDMIVTVLFKILKQQQIKHPPFPQ